MITLRILHVLPVLVSLSAHVRCAFLRYRSLWIRYWAWAHMIHRPLFVFFHESHDAGMYSALQAKSNAYWDV